jgi:hypothetical protein
MNSSQSNIIGEIAQELDCGNDCYYNSRTNEILAIPNFSQVLDEEEFKESFRIDLEKIEKHKTEFIKIEVLESFESFKLWNDLLSKCLNKNLNRNWKIF